MRILVLSPYQAYSHRIWIEQLTAGLPEFHWRVLALPARHFNWRVRSNPLQWYLGDILAQAGVPDLILATSMTDLATFRGLFHRQLGNVPAIVYFHENQFAYPLAPGATDSIEPRMINLYSALCADRVVFNSRYNQCSFLDGARNFMARMPDRLPVDCLKDVAGKSRVIPVPVRRIFYRQPLAQQPDEARLLWNHRWEYDKGPRELLAAVETMRARGFHFRLHLAGQRFRRVPDALDILRERYGHLLVDHGFLEFHCYADLLRHGGLVLSSARHDFQGLAMLEAAAAGCVPVAPDRLVYPEWFDPIHLYPSREDPEQDGEQLARRVMAMDADDGRRAAGMDAFRFEELAPRYRELFNSMA